MANQPPVFINDVTAIEADVFNGAFENVYENTVLAETARDEAVAAAEAATAATDDAVAVLVETSGSQTQGALDARFGLVVNALNYGALGDGVADDAAAINAALAAGATLGRAVLLPEGEYLIRAKLVVPSNTTLLGVHGRTILKAAATSTASPLLLEVANRTDVLVRDLVFDGSLSDEATFNNLITVYQSTRVRFDACRWQNVKGISVIFSTNTSQSGVANSHFVECGTWQKTSGDNADRRQAVAFSSGTKANNRGNYVVGCTFDEVGLDCISLSSQADALVAHNTIRGNYAGAIYVAGCSNVKVLGNHVEGIAGARGGNGVDVYTSDTVTVVGNTVTGRGAAGIMLADSSNCSVEANICLNNWQGSTSSHTSGITIFGLSSACSNVTIVGNVCTDTQGTKTQQYGVQVSNHAHTNIWIDPSNRLTGNAVAAVGGGGEFSPYTRTPSWVSFSTPGNATTSVRFTQSRDLVTEQGTLTFGSTSAFHGSSALYLGLPATPHSSIPTNGILGTFVAFDTSANTYKTGVIVKSGSNGLFVFHDSTRVTNTTPWAWATGDLLSWNLSYCPAAS